MIPLTKEGREGLRRMVAVFDEVPAGHRARADVEAIKGRDPAMTAAMAWIDGLPDGSIEPWKVYLSKGDGGCTSCPFETQISSGLCGLALYLGDGERACQYDEAPEWCRLRSGGVLVVGAMP